MKFEILAWNKNVAAGFKRLTACQPSSLISGTPTAIHIKVNNKKIHTDLFQSKRPHTTTTTNDNINIESTLAGLMNVWKGESIH
jgi:hypothetical protein